MSSDEKRPLGKILLQRKLVSQQALDAALRAQRHSAAPAPLASQLIYDGTVEEIDVLRALSEQHGVPGIDLTQIAIVLEQEAKGVPRFELAGWRVFNATSAVGAPDLILDLLPVAGAK